ncbi:MAG: type I CRISPR-associated protein Cas7, partial [Halorhabdus sp.]
MTNYTIDNRSEIVFLYDAEDCNPNGNPLSANDKPRIDETTGEAVVTDVRLKRYVRDQLDDDEYGIYVRNPSKAPYEDVPDRDELFRRVTELGEDDLDDMTGSEAADAFLNTATDVRYFGATCSFSREFQEAIGDGFPGQFIGPVQFEHGRS